MANPKYLSAILLCVFATGCGELVIDRFLPDGGIDISVDLDGDGFSSPRDCNDRDAEIYPGATEVCDGVDNDCDGEVDNPHQDAAGVVEVYIDADLDGQGDANSEPVYRCATQPGWVDNRDDCNDDNPDVFRGQGAYFDEPYWEGCDDPEGCYDYNCDGGISFGAPITDGCLHTGCTPNIGFFEGQNLECGSPARFNTGCGPYLHAGQILCVPNAETRVVDCH